MGTLREIRNKLRSVGNIKKITQAMEMVAASRLRKAQAKAEKARPYAAKLKEVLERIAVLGDDLKHPLINKRPVKTIGLIVIASDKGLCGSYNNNIFNAAHRFIKANASKPIELILFGKKAISHFSGKFLKIRKQFPEWGGKITFSEIKAFTQELINWYLTNQLDEIWIIYTHYQTITRRSVQLEKFLNIDKPIVEKKTTANYILEPNAAHIFQEILPRYLLTKIQTALDEAYASELAARILSMRSATKNAEEMIEKLTLTRNKVRQTSITREMIEITSGAESSNLK